MPIKINCPSCGKTLSAPDAAAGKKAKCPACGQVMIIPEPVHEAEPVGVGGAAPPVGLAPISAAQAVASAEQARQPCPECGEMIVAGAAKCRFCNAIFDPQLKLLQQRRPGSGNENLKQIANYQRGIILCILVQILAYGAVIALGTRSPLAGVAGLVMLCAVIAGVVFAVLLAMKVYSTAVGVIMGISAIIPCLGLVMLLIINQAATKRLTENGIKVGFLGANMSQF